jgi:hypothetical protein
MIIIKSLLIFLLAFQLTLAIPDTPSYTPPMGFTSGSQFSHCDIDCDQRPDTCISEKLYMSMADAMIQHGYKDAGYEYVNISDCWSAGRDDNDRLIADPKRFPSGIAFLAQYMKDRGLKLGIYASAGEKTCMGYAGSNDHEDDDAKTFHDWGVQYVKYAACNIDAKDLYQAYWVFSRAV